MIRRSFVGRFFAVMAACFVPAAKAQASVTPDTFPDLTERGADGRCLAKAFRKAADGHYYLVDRGEINPGDEMIQLGIDGKRLWKVTKFKVGSGGTLHHEQDGDSVYVDGEAVRLV